MYAIMFFFLFIYIFIYVSFFLFDRATAIEMVTTLAQSQHGRQYLAKQGIMDKISNMIRGAETDPFSSFYLPGESPKKIIQIQP